MKLSGYHEIATPSGIHPAPGTESQIGSGPVLASGTSASARGAPGGLSTNRYYRRARRREQERPWMVSRDYAYGT